MYANITVYNPVIIFYIYVLYDIIFIGPIRVSSPFYSYHGGISISKRRLFRRIFLIFENWVLIDLIIFEIETRYL